MVTPSCGIALAASLVASAATRPGRGNSAIHAWNRPLNGFPAVHCGKRMAGSRNHVADIDRQKYRVSGASGPESVNSNLPYCPHRPHSVLHYVRSAKSLSLRLRGQHAITGPPGTTTKRHVGAM